MGLSTLFFQPLRRGHIPGMLRVYSTRNTFSSLSEGEHTSRRRRYAKIYAKSSIQKSPHVLKILSAVLIGRYMPIINESARNGTPVNVLGLDFAYGFDVVSAYIFGIGRSTNFVDVKARELWLAAYFNSHPTDYMFWVLELPKLTRWLTKIGVRLMPKWSSEARNDLEQ